MDDERRKQLRKFGVVMAVAFAALGSLLLWRGHAVGQYLVVVGGLFLVTAVVLPRALDPLERAWMAFAGVLQRIMTTVILTLTYYLMMTPLGLLIRLSGKDLLGKRPDPEMESYWVPLEEDGPHTRPDKPY